MLETRVVTSLVEVLPSRLFALTLRTHDAVRLKGPYRFRRLASTAAQSPTSSVPAAVTPHAPPLLADSVMGGAGESLGHSPRPHAPPHLADSVEGGADEST